jgi:prolipoprotein diacylglyceryltransferase
MTGKVLNMEQVLSVPFVMPGIILILISMKREISDKAVKGNSIKDINSILKESFFYSK